MGATTTREHRVTKPGVRQAIRMGATTAGGPVLTDDERVDQASLGSFPASDPPPWTSGHEWPRRELGDTDDLDGGDERERARRRRHID
jgi:hypothetical protein